MLNSVSVDPLQKITENNYNNFGRFPRKTFDVYTKDLFGSGAWYAGFNCVDGGQGQVVVGNGRFYLDGVGFYNDTPSGEVVNLLPDAPTQNTRWVAIVVSGETIDTDTRPTTFLTDTTTRTTTSRNKSQESRRFANVGRILGAVAADPVFPTITGGNLAVAYVLLSSSGVRQIVPNVLSRAPSAVQSHLRLNENDVWRAGVGIQIDALGSNVSALASQVRGAASAFGLKEVMRDLARIKEALGRPDDYSLYGSDHYLTDDESDTTNVAYLANIEEGIRFPPAAVRDAQISLLNPYEATVVTMSGQLIPKYRVVEGLSNKSHDTEIILNQYQYQEVQVQQKSMVRERLRIGPYFETCTNYLWWAGGKGAYNSQTGIFTLTNGETFEVYEDDRYILDGISATGVAGHQMVRARSIWHDGFEEVAYTDTKLIRQTVSGALNANTMISPQDGWLLDHGFYFTAKAATGDVTVMLMEVTDAGVPDYKKVIGTATIASSDIKISASGAEVPTFAHFSPPIFLKKGVRYATAAISAGAHRVAMSTGNKFAEGSHFVSTDGAFQQGDLQRDLCFVWNFAKFESSRVEVQLQPLELNGGIVAIDILSQMFVPPGSTLSFMAQFNGVWRELSTLISNDQALVGQPPLLPFKAVFQGTPDLMPSLGVASNSRVRTMRPRNDFRHFSKAHQLPSGVTTTSIEVTTRLEAWGMAPSHGHSTHIRYGAGYNSTVGATASQTIVAPDDPRALIRTDVFVLPSPQSSYKIEQRGYTDNVVTCFHVADMTHIAN